MTNDTPIAAKFDRHGWLLVDENTPSDGRPVFIWGGFLDHEAGREYLPVKLTNADGEWWRVSGLKSTPTHWQPAIWPAPPETET